MSNAKVWIRDWISERFQRIDHVLVPSVTLDKFSQFVDSIMPIDNGHELVRIGDAADGSYLIPDDLAGIGVNISPGVGETFHFEKDLIENYGIPSIMLDASVEKPSNLPPGLEFVDKFVVAISDSNLGVSISELISEASNRWGHNIDFLLQMDIEGAEYEILSSLHPDDLTRFRILSIEFHDMELWVQNSFFAKTLSPAFSTLLKHFDVVHSRANNTSHTFRYKGFFIPSALELTFHRKDRLISRNGYRQLPSVLDFVEKQYTSQETPFSKK